MLLRACNSMVDQLEKTPDSTLTSLANILILRLLFVPPILSCIFECGMIIASLLMMVRVSYQASSSSYMTFFSNINLLCLATASICFYIQEFFCAVGIMCYIGIARLIIAYVNKPNSITKATQKINLFIIAYHNAYTVLLILIFCFIFSFTFEFPSG